MQAATPTSRPFRIYKPGDVVGTRTLIRPFTHRGRGVWEFRCICGEVTVGQIYWCKRNLTCIHCHLLLRGHLAKPLPPVASRDPYRPQIVDIRRAVCAHFGLTMGEMLGDSRKARVARPRQLAMLLSRDLTENSYPYIGQRFGGRDHSTAIFSVERMRARIRAYPEWAAHYEAIRLELDVRATVEIEP